MSRIDTHPLPLCALRACIALQDAKDKASKPLARIVVRAAQRAERAPHQRIALTLRVSMWEANSH